MRFGWEMAPSTSNSSNSENPPKVTKKVASLSELSSNDRDIEINHQEEDYIRTNLKNLYYLDEDLEVIEDEDIE